MKGSVFLITALILVAGNGCAVSQQKPRLSLGLPAVTQRSWQRAATSDCDQAIGRSSAGGHDRQHAAGVSVEYGKDRPVIDAIGWVVGVPHKLLLWNARVDNHRVSEVTVDEVESYLIDHQLNDVKIRVNQYAPLDECRRLIANKEVGAGWRYTLGLGSLVIYTLLPGRIWGGDAYNPYTDSVYLYSDVPAMGIVESAYAKDVHSREHPGTYAAVQSLPLVAMWHETLATNETLQYVAIHGTREEQDRTRQLLYARYGMALGGEIAGISTPAGVKVGNVFQVVGAVGGHATALYKNRR